EVAEDPRQRDRTGEVEATAIEGVCIAEGDRAAFRRAEPDRASAAPQHHRPCTDDTICGGHDDVVGAGVDLRVEAEETRDSAVRPCPAATRPWAAGTTTWSERDPACASERRRLVVAPCARSPAPAHVSSGSGVVPVHSIGGSS